MKTFSKILSMILVAVMCFGLFATSAYAFDFDFDNSADSAGGFVADTGSSFSFDLGNGGFTESADNSDANDFSFNSSVAQDPAKDENSFTLNLEPVEEKDDSAEEKKEADGFEFSFETSTTAAFDTPYAAGMTFSVTPAGTTKKNPSDITISITSPSGAKFETDTFVEVRYSKNPTGDGYSILNPGTDYTYDGTNLIIFKSWVQKSSVECTNYYFFGTRPSDPMIKLGSVTISKGDFTDGGTVNPNVYDKYTANKDIVVTPTETAEMKGGYGIATADNSYNHVLKGGEYTVSGTKLTIDKGYLRTLPDGTYYVVGFPFANDLKTYVQMGSFTVKSSTDGGWPVDKWYLTPDYTGQPWTSGDTYLMFSSNLMAMRNTFPNYTIVPRYGYGYNSIPNNIIDVNQYYDMGDGVFALGINFLSSLPAGVYTLQVVDYRHLEDCTNVVHFEIGSTLRAIDTDKHVIGSIKNLRFLCDEPVYEVYVGNIPLTRGVDYALSNGDKTITLSFEFLNNRMAGKTYNIKALTYSGTYPSSTFQILSTAQGSASPRTGDESNLGLWAAFLLLSGTAVVVLVPKLRKHDF